MVADATSQNSPISVTTNERLSIIGDFDGDKIKDTIFESYISSLTKRECPKSFDTEDFEKDIELIINQKPITRIYSNIVGIDTLIVSTETQQTGIDWFSNLGDLNADGTEEFGYIINWADYSNINTFHIMTIKGKYFKELLTFKVNESINLETENLIDEKFLIKPVDKKTIEFQFYSDSATVETGRHKFD